MRLLALNWRGFLGDWFFRVYWSGWCFFLLFGSKKEKGICTTRISDYWIPDQAGNDTKLMVDSYLLIPDTYTYADRNFR